ncbi:MAG: protein-disulfide reductase DsbD [Spongiibacteraceae bacterium]
MRFLTALLFICCAASSWAAPDPFSKNGVVVHDEFLPVEQAYQLLIDFSGDHLLAHWDIAEGYYLYRHQLSFKTAAGTDLQAEIPAGKVKEDEYFGRVEVYYHNLDIPLQGEPLGSVPATPFTLVVTSQGCADAGLCYPPRTEQFAVDPQARTATPIAATSPSKTPVASSAPGPAVTAPPLGASGWVTLLLGALLGGAILNLMPCVFPVLSLKVLSFANHKEQSQAIHGLVYTLGVVASFVAVAALLLALKAGGSAVGWGFQLQQPWFVGALAYLFFAMGLSLSGFWELGGSWLSFGGTLASRTDYSGSFFTGVLATVVASPCTAPFMATALGFAITQPPAPALAVFATLGFGMALPVLLLCLNPALLRKMPRPGNWMIRFKQALAFPLYGTAIWLCWIVGRQAGSTAMALVLLGALLLTLALWLWRFAPLARGVAALCLAGALGFLGSSWLSATPIVAASHDRWTPYKAETLAELRKAGTPVFVDLTADWCITCLTNDKVALGREPVQRAFADHGVAMLRGDWTQYDPAITELLAQFGRNGVPLYLYYPAGGEAVVLPQLLTPSIVVDAITANNSASDGKRS